MATSLERNPGVLSHDFYTGPTEAQLGMIKKLTRLQEKYADLCSANPLFTEHTKEWVGQENDDYATFGALVQFDLELDAEFEGMTPEEKESNPDADLHKMVKLRLKIAKLKLDIESSALVTGVDLGALIPTAA